jgi:integrase
MDYMRDEKQYSNSTQNQALKAVKSFFDANKLQFKIKPLRRRRISGGVLRITTDQIREVYDYAMGIEWTTLRNRALYMLLKDSGLRISDCSALDVEQYRNARDVEIRGIPFKVFEPFATVKTGDLAHTILGPESTKVLDKLIGERVSGPIFLDGKGNRWRAPAMGTHFRRVKEYVLGGKLRISAHSFRKYNTTILESAGMPSEWIKLLQGKKAYVYSRPQDGPELLEAYAQAYDKLRIFPHAHLDQEVENLREQVIRQDRTLHQFSDIVTEIQDKMTLYAPLIDDLIQANKEGTQLQNLDERLKELQVKPVKE